MHACELTLACNTETRGALYERGHLSTRLWSGLTLVTRVYHYSYCEDDERTKKATNRPLTHHPK